MLASRCEQHVLLIGILVLDQVEETTSLRLLHVKLEAIVVGDRLAVLLTSIKRI